MKLAIRIVCGLLLVPVLQVIVIRFVNPPTTIPAILHNITSPHSSARYEWRNIEDVPLIFLEHCLVAEDQRFFQHHGFDWREIRLARTRAQQNGTPPRGASTVTMQCARSLFLWQGRSWIRKGVEAFYTILMELILSKKRILELYVNVIELGEGVYGVESGARRHFGLPAHKLTREQSALLVALLPNPKRSNPKNPSPNLLARQEMILRRENEFALPRWLLH